MMQAIILGAALCLSSTAASAQDEGPGKVMEDFSRSWDNSDAKGIGALFAPDADFVATDGLFAKGRDNIEAYYATAFAHGFSGSTGIGEVLQQRTISPEFVLLDARFTIRGVHDQVGSPEADQKGSMVALLRRQGANWRIVALRERSGGAFTPFP